MLRRHNAVRSTVSFSRDHRDLWNSRFGEGIEQFCSVSDYAVMLLIYAGQETRDVFESDQRDIEAIAKPHKTGRFH